MRDKALGWIGVGTMGGPMAQRLAQAGYRLTVCGSGRRNLSDYAAEAGASLANNPRELMAVSNVVFTMIPNGEVLLEIVSGENGLAAAEMKGKILIDMSTVDAETSARVAALVAEKGGSFLRAPVTGSVHYAREGTLGIMVSGPKESYESCRPYFDVLGNRCTYLGPGEEARHIKLIINMMLGHILQSLSEALVLGEKLGLPWEMMIDLISDSAAASPLVKYKAGTIKARDFEPTSTGYNMHKDMKLAMQLAQKVDAALPMTAVTLQMYNALVSMGLSDLDSSALLLVNERLSAVEPEKAAADVPYKT